MSLIIEEEVEITLDFEYEDIINKAVSATLDYVKCPYEAEINILITDNENIRIINKNFRNIDRETDVLSFPAFEYDNPGDFSVIDEEDDSFFDPDTGELIFGDMMISVEKIISQAKEFGHSTLRELSFLVVHSTLHLCGYDHIEESDRIIMEDLQRKIMEELNISR